MRITDTKHTIAIMSVLNRVIKENDGSVTHFHLSTISSKITGTQIAKKRVEEVLQKLRKGIDTTVDNGESEVDIDGYISVKFQLKSDGIVSCTVRECPYREWCIKILPMVTDNDEELMVLPCTILMECCLQDSAGGVRKVEPGEDSCEIEIALRH